MHKLVTTDKAITVLVLVMQRFFCEVRNNFNRYLNELQGSGFQFTGFPFNRHGVLYSIMNSNCEKAEAPFNKWTPEK